MRLPWASRHNRDTAPLGSSSSTWNFGTAPVSRVAFGLALGTMLWVPAARHGAFASRLDRCSRFPHSDIDVHRHSNSQRCPCHLLHQLRLLHLCLHTRLGYGSCRCHGASQTYHQHAEVIVVSGEPQNHREDRAGVHRHLKDGPWSLTCSIARRKSSAVRLRVA